MVNHNLASHGLSRHATIRHTTAVSQEADLTGMTTKTQSGGFSVFAVVQANLPFITLLVSWLALWLLRPQIYCAREFYRHCFKRECWYAPWRRWLFDLIWTIMDIAFVVALVHYFYVYEHNSMEGESANRYIAVFAVALVFFFLRWFWFNTFWNYHNLKNTRVESGMPVFDYSAGIALAVAVVLAVLMFAAVATLLVLFGIEHDWLALVMMILNLIWSAFVIAWSAIVYSCVATCA